VRAILALILIAALPLAGCVQSEVIVLKNPQTGEIKECRGQSGSSFFPIAQTAIDNSAAESCARGYQAAGFIKLN
jgi:PBP1b-binding outer membrane lipoprotein LpoB